VFPRRPNSWNGVTGTAAVRFERRTLEDASAFPRHGERAGRGSVDDAGNMLDTLV
jgi:hypothetical protein